MMKMYGAQKVVCEGGGCATVLARGKLIQLSCEGFDNTQERMLALERLAQEEWFEARGEVCGT